MPVFDMRDRLLNVSLTLSGSLRDADDVNSSTSNNQENSLKGKILLDGMLQIEVTIGHTLSDSRNTDKAAKPLLFRSSPDVWHRKRT
jgi:hypothetical protein